MSPVLFGLYKLAKYAVLPYTWLVLLFGLTWILSRDGAAGSPRRRLRLLAIAGVLVSWGLGNAFVASTLIGLLESQYPPIELPSARTYGAIVVLGGGLRSAGTLRPDTELSWMTMERTLCGVELYRAGVAPRLLFTGGDPAIFGRGPVEAEEMKRLALKLDVPEEAIAVEGNSRTTYESAVETGRLLGAAPVLLVTSASHIPRALGLFRKQGLDATPAPCGYLAQNRPGTGWQFDPFALLPDVRDLHTSTYAINELVGSLVYRLTGKL